MNKGITMVCAIILLVMVACAARAEERIVSLVIGLDGTQSMYDKHTGNMAEDGDGTDHEAADASKSRLDLTALLLALAYKENVALRLMPYNDKVFTGTIYETRLAREGYSIDEIMQALMHDMRTGTGESLGVSLVYEKALQERKKAYSEDHAAEYLLLFSDGGFNKPNSVNFDNLLSTMDDVGITVVPILYVPEKVVRNNELKQYMGYLYMKKAADETGWPLFPEASRLAEDQDRERMETLLRVAEEIFGRIEMKTPDAGDIAVKGGRRWLTVQIPHGGVRKVVAILPGASVQEFAMETEYQENVELDIQAFNSPNRFMVLMANPATQGQWTMGIGRKSAGGALGEQDIQLAYVLDDYSISVSTSEKKLHKKEIFTYALALEVDGEALPVFEKNKVTIRVLKDDAEISKKEVALNPEGTFSETLYPEDLGITAYDTYTLEARYNDGLGEIMLGETTVTLENRPPCIPEGKTASIMIDDLPSAEDMSGEKWRESILDMSEIWDDDDEGITILHVACEHGSPSWKGSWVDFSHCLPVREEQVTLRLHDIPGSDEACTFTLAAESLEERLRGALIPVMYLEEPDSGPVTIAKNETRRVYIQWQPSNEAAETLLRDEYVRDRVLSLLQPLKVRVYKGEEDRAPVEYSMKTQVEPDDTPFVYTSYFDYSPEGYVGAVLIDSGSLPQGESLIEKTLGYSFEVVNTPPYFDKSWNENNDEKWTMRIFENSIPVDMKELFKDDDNDILYYGHRVSGEAVKVKETDENTIFTILRNRLASGEAAVYFFAAENEAALEAIESGVQSGDVANMPAPIVVDVETYLYVIGFVLTVLIAIPVVIHFQRQYGEDSYLHWTIEWREKDTPEKKRRLDPEKRQGALMRKRYTLSEILDEENAFALRTIKGRILPGRKRRREHDTIRISRCLYQYLDADDKKVHIGYVLMHKGDKLTIPITDSRGNSYGECHVRFSGKE